MSKRTPAPPLATGYATGLIRQRRWRGSPAARALSYLRRKLRSVLEQSGLLGVRTLRSRSFRDCAYIVCTSFKARFGFYQPAIWTRTETTRRVGDALVDALETVAAATLEAVLVHLQPTRPKVLACVQLTTMDAGATRGAHYDNTEHGDLVITVTLEGAGVVFFYEGARCSGRSAATACTWYALYGHGLTHYKHAVRAGAQQRVSATFRYVNV